LGMDRETFFRELLADRTAKSIIIDGVTVRAKYKRGRGRRLLVIFHSALPPNSGNRPNFSNFLQLDVPQLAISDPTLEGRDDLTAGWYLGAAGRSLPQIIRGLVTDFSETIRCQERIYLGGSSGGFAALLYSSLDPTSLAIAVCPQCDLDLYDNTNVAKWRSQCFPDVPLGVPVKEFTGVDLIKFYSGSFRNSVVILLSSGDFVHLFGQIAPLLSSIKWSQRSQFLLNVEYHGIPNHSGSVPQIHWLSWVRAAFAAKTFQATELMDAHFILRARTDVSGGSGGNGSQDGNLSRDARMTDLLRAYELREDKE
jgi:hypothetical protein